MSDTVPLPEPAYPASAPYSPSKDAWSLENLRAYGDACRAAEREAFAAQLSQSREREAFYLAAARDAQEFASMYGSQVAALRAALCRIARWFGEFPDTGRFWDEPANTRPMSYGAAMGSNGERDYMRGVAQRALTDAAALAAAPQPAQAE